MELEFNVGPDARQRQDEKNKFDARVTVGIVNQIKRLELAVLRAEGGTVNWAQNELALAVAYSNWLLSKGDQ